MRSPETMEAELLALAEEAERLAREVRTIAERTLALQAEMDAFDRAPSRGVAPSAAHATFRRIARSS